MFAQNVRDSWISCMVRAQCCSCLASLSSSVCLMTYMTPWEPSTQGRLRNTSSSIPWKPWKVKYQISEKSSLLHHVRNSSSVKINWKREKNNGCATSGGDTHHFVFYLSLPAHIQPGVPSRTYVFHLTLKGQRKRDCLYPILVYTTQVNSTFCVRWLASSEVISQVLFTSE